MDGEGEKITENGIKCNIICEKDGMRGDEAEEDSGFDRIKTDKYGA